MKKNYAYFVALASLAIATSCSEENLQSGGAVSKNEIAVHPTIENVGSRATETTTSNLTSFKTFSFLTGDDKNYMDGVTYNGNGGEWTSQDGTFYWPVTGDLNFYSYAPAQPGSDGTVSITPLTQKLTGFVPYATAATQQDFIYSKAKGNLADNGSTGVDLNFDHALSEITVQAQNSNTAYTVEVSGVKVGNVISKGDFTFPSLSGDDAAWSLGTEKSDYTTEWESATTLTSIYSSLDASNTAFMLLPQQLVAETKASDGSYIALKVKITMQGGQVIHDGWAYVAVPTLWEMGKHYNYTVDFSSGAGQDENGNDIISGTNVTLKVNVTPWDENYITLPSYIYGINSDDKAFYIKSIKITPNSDGEWKIATKSIDNTNLSGLFSGLRTTLSLNLSDFDTHKVTNMQYMFNYCKSLSKLNLSRFNTSNVTNLSGLFNGCHSLASLDLSKFNTSKVTNMRFMFCECKSLTTLDLTGWNTSNVTNMSGMFDFCTSMTSLNLSQLNTQNVTDMSAMFNNCSSLTTLDVANFDTQNVTDMSAMFYGCRTLTSLDLSNFDTSKVTEMTSMFNSCSSLTSLDLSNFDTSNVTNIGSMFNGCFSLTTLDLSGWNTSNVTDINNIFSKGIPLKTIYMVGCDNTTIDKIKSALTEAKLSTDIIKTTKE